MPNYKGFRFLFSWKANGPVNIPIIFSFIGFFFAALLLLPCGCGDSYHDLVLENKKALKDTLLDRRIKKLQPVYDSLLSKKDSSKAGVQEMQRVRNLLQGSINEKYRLHHSNADTNLTYYATSFSVDRILLYDTILNLGKHSTDTVHIPVVLIDSAIFPNSLSLAVDTELVLRKEKRSVVQFATTYPNFGFLYLLSIGQMVAWCLIVALVIGSLVRTNDILPGHEYNWKNAWIHYLLPTITLVLFNLFFYLWLIGDHVIKDSYFLGHFNTRTSIYSISGYMVAVFCFSSYLFLSNKLEMLPTGIAPTDPRYTRLKSAFDFSFFCSALILSLFVFFLGVLFHATNDIEGMHFYELISGKPFIDYNYVYMVGLIHSIILAIFYIPTKIRFNSMVVAQQQQAGGGSMTKFFKALWESLGSILITLSPLLATVVEKLVNALLG
jgi:hypothetical protein